MLAKLISLLIHAKSGAISGAFLLGATGALVSVSASNGVTTITITQASPSPSASTSPTVTSRTARPSLAAVTTPATAACSDEATALAFQTQRVESAAAGFHTDLAKLRGLRGRATLEKADDMLRLIRHAATKAIHATATAACVKKDDDDEDENEDEDDDNDKDDHESSLKSMDTAARVTVLSFVEEKTNDEDNDDHGRRLGLTFTGDAKVIADQAIAAMQVAFDTAKNAPVRTPKATPTPRTETKARTAPPTRSPDHQGEHRD